MTDEMLLLLAGVLAPFIVQLVKEIRFRLYKADLYPFVPLSSQAALGWTYGVCLVLAVLSKIALGEVLVPAGDLPTVLQSVLMQLSVVLGLATFVYKTLLSQETSILVRR